TRFLDPAASRQTRHAIAAGRQGHRIRRVEGNDPAPGDLAAGDKLRATSGAFRRPPIELCAAAFAILWLHWRCQENRKDVGAPPDAPCSLWIVNNLCSSLAGTHLENNCANGGRGVRALGR